MGVAFATVALAGCSQFQEDNLFDESAALRIEHNAEKLQNILVDEFRSLERGNHQPNLLYVHLAGGIFLAGLYIISPLRLMELPIVHPNDFSLRQGRDVVGQYNGIDVPVPFVVEFLDATSRVVVIYDSFVGIHDNTLANWRNFALILLSHDTHIISYSRQKVNTPLGYSYQLC